GEPDDVGERPFKERASQQIQPDGGEGGTPLGQIGRRVGDGSVAAAWGELAHIMHAPQRSRVQRGRRTPPRPRACAFLQGDEFRGPVQIVARLEVVNAEKRVGDRAPLRHIWLDVIWHACAGLSRQEVFDSSPKTLIPTTRPRAPSESGASIMTRAQTT